MSRPIDSVDGSDREEDAAAEDFTICPDCGEDLPHHVCDGRRADA